METVLRIPEDPPEFDVVPWTRCPDCAVGHFSGTSRCPKRPRRPGDAPSYRNDGIVFLCQPENRPDRKHAMYVPRKLYGNEEEG